jgi:hypothetical protein
MKQKEEFRQAVHLIVRNYFEDSGILGMIILKGILQKYYITPGID